MSEEKIHWSRYFDGRSIDSFYGNYVLSRKYGQLHYQLWTMGFMW